LSSANEAILILGSQPATLASPAVNGYIDFFMNLLPIQDKKEYMTVTIFNTLNSRKVPLEPIEPGHVKIYVCGITAYDYCHIGHARSALVFDMIVGYLQYLGLNVTYIRNFTDIDDKIINRAQEQNTSTIALSEQFIHAFHEDMAHLGIASPTAEPKATEHLPEIIGMIQELMAKGLAYQAGSDVFYAVEKFQPYGILSGRSLNEMKAGARISINENKRNPMDFALWKGSKPGEPTWESPWGPGRPGWHIECSAMSKKYLGESFDIHGGGKDLVFPHHENEIAQSQGASGKTFVNIWVHNGFVTINDEKMSKSLGNFLTIRDLLAQYQPEALRLFVFSTHYRNPLDYSEAAMQDAVTGLDRLYTCLAEIAQITASGNPTAKPEATVKEIEKIESLTERFQEAMNNDFNTAQALGHIFEIVKILNRIKQALPSNPATTDLDLLRKASTTIRELAGLIGLLRQEPSLYLNCQQQKILAGLDISKESIEQLIQDRLTARRQKDWARADAIRGQLLSHNIELKDGANGTAWSVKPG